MTDPVSVVIVVIRCRVSAGNEAVGSTRLSSRPVLSPPNVTSGTLAAVPPAVVSSPWWLIVDRNRVGDDPSPVAGMACLNVQLSTGA